VAQAFQPVMHRPVLHRLESGATKFQKGKGDRRAALFVCLAFAFTDY
jgi:hypothetical protein